MRIRKNAKLSSLMFSHASGAQPLQAHVCQLNQSPWDVIPFSQEDTYPSSSLIQCDGEDSFNGNGSLGDSIGAVESVASMMMEDDVEEKAAVIEMKVDDTVIIDDNHENGGNYKRAMFDDYEEMKMESDFKLKKFEKVNPKRDAKGWHCKNNDPKNIGQNMCDYHDPAFLKSCSDNNVITTTTPTGKKSDKGTIIGSRRSRGKSAKKLGSSSSSNPYEFYYYSGFGPCWGKRRGGERDSGNKNSHEGRGVVDDCDCTIIDTVAPQNTTPSSSSSPIEDNHQEFDYVDEYDDEEEEDDEDGDSGKKRMRKPVKARSLKSLM